LATSPSGLSTVIIAGPTQLEEIKINTQSDINDVKVKTMGPSDVYVVHNTIVPRRTHRLALASWPLHHFSESGHGDRIQQRRSQHPACPRRRHLLRG
jgi:hypothetical protein